MRTLRNRRKSKATRRNLTGGYITRIGKTWDVRNKKKSDKDVVNKYREKEVYILQLLAKDCVNNDSNLCLEQEGVILVAEYKRICAIYEEHADKETYFSQLQKIKNEIGEIIKLRVQDSKSFVIKTTEDERKKTTHRNRINYWSAIFTEIKKEFDKIRQLRYDSSITEVTLEYETLKLKGLSEEQCKAIKDAYHKTSSLIVDLNRENMLMGNKLNASVIEALTQRNIDRKPLYDTANDPDLPRHRREFAHAKKKYDELGLGEKIAIDEQDIQTRIIQENKLQMDRELEEKHKEEQRIEKERMAKETLKKKVAEDKDIQSKKKKERAQEKVEEDLAVKKAIQDANEDRIMGKWKYLASLISIAMSEDIKGEMMKFNTQVKEIMTLDITKEDRLRQIEKITTTWETYLDEEAKKIKRSAKDRASASTEASKISSVEDVYRWENIQDEIAVLPESELKTQLIVIDSQIDALVYSSMDRTEMNVDVKRLMDKGELLIKRDELIKATRAIHDDKERSDLMINNNLLDEIPELTIDEKHAQMEKIITDWKEKLTEAHAMQTHREILPTELFQRLVRLKEKRKLIDPSDPLFKIINIHNGLIDKFIYKEDLDIEKIEAQIVKWELVK